MSAASVELLLLHDNVLDTLAAHSDKLAHTSNLGPNHTTAISALAGAALYEDELKAEPTVMEYAIVRIDNGEHSPWLSSLIMPNDLQTYKLSFCTPLGKQDIAGAESVGYHTLQTHRLLAHITDYTPVSSQRFIERLQESPAVLLGSYLGALIMRHRNTSPLYAASSPIAPSEIRRWGTPENEFDEVTEPLHANE